MLIVVNFLISLIISFGLIFLREHDDYDIDNTKKVFALRFVAASLLTIILYVLFAYIVYLITFSIKDITVGKWYYEDKVLISDNSDSDNTYYTDMVKEDYTISYTEYYLSWFNVRETNHSIYVLGEKSYGR